MRLFHATRSANIESILKKGLLPTFGEVYLTDSQESATRWMGFRFKAMGEREFAVIEVLDQNKMLKE